MNRVLLQVAARTTAGTQDITDASIGTCKFALAWMSNATALDTNTAGANESYGLYDGSNVYNQTMHAADVTSPSSAYWCSSTSNFLGVTSTGGLYAAAATVSFITNGIRLNWSTAPASGMIITVLLLSGADIEASVCTGAFTSSSAAENIALTYPKLSAPADTLICLSAHVAVGTGSGTPRFSLGFFDRASGAYACSAIRVVGTQNPTQSGHGQFTDCIAALLGSAPFTSQLYKVTVGSFTASGFTMSSSAAAGTAVMAFAALRFIGNKATYVGTAVLPTSTGAFSPVTGMAVQPQVALAAPTMRTATGSAQGNSGFGLFATVYTAAATTQQGGVINMSKDAVSGSAVEKAQASYSDSLKILDATGAASVRAALSTWNSDGITLNASAASSAYRVAYLAFGTSSATNTSVAVDSGAVNFTGGVIDGSMDVPWTEGALRFTGQNITLNASGMAYAISVDAGQLSFAGQPLRLDQSPGFVSGALLLTGQDIGLYTAPIINPGAPVDVWAGDLAVQKNWQFVGGLGYAAALRMKTASSGIQVQLSAIDYVFKPGGVL